MSEWQTIDSAPKDLAVLVWWPDWTSWPSAAYWDNEEDMWVLAGQHSPRYCKGPTHWQPLPEPPEAGEIT